MELLHRKVAQDFQESSHQRKLKDFQENIKYILEYTNLKQR